MQTTWRSLMATRAALTAAAGQPAAAASPRCSGPKTSWMRQRCTQVGMRATQLSTDANILAGLKKFHACVFLC